MKKLVINSPRPGRSTATLVTHVYDHVSKRTRTVYLGCLGVGVDPDLIPDDASIAPGERRYGIRVSKTSVRPLDPEDLAGIRAWLEAHGSYRQLQARLLESKLAIESCRALERAEMRSEVEAELRSCIEKEVRDAMEHERRASELTPLQAAMAALERAAEHVVEAAARLRADGHRVSNTRRASLMVGAGSSPLDALQAEANCIRIEGLAKFEASCKAARLMAHRSRERAQS
jgi:hypothetical protein